MAHFSLDSLTKVTEKVNLLNSLENIQIATKILEEHSDASDSNMLDENYAKLNSNLRALSSDENEFKVVSEYLKNTHASTHSNYTLDIEEIFDVDRP